MLKFKPRPKQTPKMYWVLFSEERGNCYWWSHRDEERDYYSYAESYAIKNNNAYLKAFKSEDACEREIKRSFSVGSMYKSFVKPVLIDVNELIEIGANIDYVEV